MKQQVRYWCFFLLVSFLQLFSTAEGYHIAGGDFTYRWISGNTFEIKLTLFRDCSNPIGSDFDSTLIIAVYERGTNNLADTVVLRGHVKDSLNLEGTACEQPPQICLIAGTYTGYINIPPNPGGYYMVWERCCRNSVINNIIMPEQAGMAFYAELANPALHNSSPVFNSHPAPFICENQLFRYSFQATDVDGDSLVYSLADPLDGGHTSQFDPNPFSFDGSSTGPREPDPAPYNSTNWFPGYDITNICGSTIPLTINSQTGEIEVHADAQGIYAMAVEVKEFRNGIQIGMIRREIQLTVILCSSNAVPQFPSPYTTIADVELYAGDTLNLRLLAKDANGDSIYITRNGNIFANSPSPVIDPPYASAAITNGVDSAEIIFTWNTGCHHASSTPYPVQITATDNGCPTSLTDFGTINIYVKPQPVIAKSNLLCIDLISDSILQISRVSDTSYNERYFNYFKLYRSTNGGPFIPVSVINEVNPLHITDSTAYDNRRNDYCYVISSVNNCNIEGDWSDTLCSVTHINTHINYISSVTVAGEQEVNLKWKEFNDGPYAVYYIYSAGQDSVFSLETALVNYNKYNWQDQNVNTSSESKCYYMVNEDVCGNVSSPSPVACSILLTGESSLFVHNLRWTKYINWQGGVDRYEIMRKAVFSNEPYANVFIDDSSLVYIDYILSSSASVYSYYVKAFEGSGGEDAESNSNEVILEQEPLLYLPNSFTPNDDGKNDFFSAQSSFVSEMILSIYNRWGEQIYFSTSTEEGWDGNVNGKSAGSGVYFYRIKYKSINSPDFIEQSGSITLIR